MTIEERIKKELKKIICEMIDTEFEKHVAEIIKSGRLPLESNLTAKEALQKESRLTEDDINDDAN